MTAESLDQSIRENKLVFFSRTKKRLWLKGEESGHFLVIKDLLLDCDQDTILALVEPQGPTCHTGSDTCWNEENSSIHFLSQLEETIRDRKENPSQKSYTSSLFAKGMNKIAQKVGEEAVELVIEAKDNDKELFLGEAADLLFHYLILLQAKSFSLQDVIAVLEERNSK